MSEEVSKYHVKSNKETNTPKFAESEIRAVAERLWWHKASKKTVAKFTVNDRTEEEVDELQDTREYKEYVEKIVFERFSTTDFEKWIENHGNMYEEFGKRMGLDPEVVEGMVERVRWKLNS